MVSHACGRVLPGCVEASLFQTLRADIEVAIVHGL